MKIYRRSEEESDEVKVSQITILNLSKILSLGNYHNFIIFM